VAGRASASIVTAAATHSSRSISARKIFVSAATARGRSARMPRSRFGTEGIYLHAAWIRISTAVPYLLLTHNQVDWFGTDGVRKAAPPWDNGVVNLMPPPRKRRRRWRGVDKANRPLRPAFATPAIGNFCRTNEFATGGHAGGGRTAGDSCGAAEKPRPHDTWRNVWANRMACVGKEFPLDCPGYGGDILLI